MKQETKFVVGDRVTLSEDGTLCLTGKVVDVYPGTRHYTYEVEWDDGPFGQYWASELKRV